MAGGKRQSKRVTPEPQRRARWLLPAVLCIAGLVGLGAWLLPKRADDGGPPGALPKDNLVLLTIDTLRADHLGVYGYSRATSPHIDELALQGTVFTQAEVQWPKTGPSVASIMSSTYCAVNGARGLHRRLDDRLLLLAEVMRDNGYRTVAFVANVNVGTYFNFTQGFDEVHEMWDTSDGVKRSNQEASFVPNDEIARQVLAWLADHHEQPFFLWVHLLDPHGPYLPPESLAGKFTADDLHAGGAEAAPRYRLPRYQRTEGLTTVGDFVAAYDAEIASSDEVMGSILGALDQHGLTERSLVVLSADHGESLGEHNYWFNHGRYVYEACTRVPLIFRYPGRVAEGRRIETPVEMLSLVPTVLDLLNVAPTQPTSQFQGRSLYRALLGDPLDPQLVFMESRDFQLAVRDGRWKFIMDPRPSSPAIPVVGRYQLYDLDVDPMETRNLFDANPDVAGRLRGELEDWVARMTAFRIPSAGQDIPEQQLDAEILRKLGTLGYAKQGADPPTSTSQPAEETDDP
ncbi:MAG: sulfatase-like hydrolase/transferase [bacterium]|nr:sulfatase-like hydrolase/transferase [bacterium]